MPSEKASIQIISRSSGGRSKSELPLVDVVIIVDVLASVNFVRSRYGEPGVEELDLMEGRKLESSSNKHNFKL